MAFTIGINDALVVSPHDGCVPRQASIGVVDGRIDYVGAKRLGAEDALTLVDGAGRVLMPGLVNGHNHGDMTVARGLGDGRTLLQQNQDFASHQWFGKWLTADDLYWSRQLTYLEALLGGTTFILENSFWNHPDAVRAMTDIGIRGAIAMDVRPNFLEPDRLVADNVIEDFRASCEAAALLPVIGSISEEDFTAERIKRVRDLLAPHAIHVTSHLAETVWRDRLSRENCGLSPVMAMARFGYFDHRYLASHMVHLAPEDIAVVAERGVKVVNTPVAEMKIADGIAPIPRLLQAGIQVALGTDGALWNNSIDLFGEMRQMLLLHSLTSGPGSITPQQIIEMATVNGAAAFGLADDFGTIEPGKSADFILIDITTPKLRPLNLGVRENVTSALVGLVNAGDVTDVFIRGERLVANGAIQTINIDVVLDHVQAAHDKIAAAIE